MSKIQHFKRTTSSGSTVTKGEGKGTVKSDGSVVRHTSSSSTPRSRARSDWKSQIQTQAQADRLAIYGHLEPLTDALIDELLHKGFTHAHLLAVRSMGYVYSRKRNSFVRDLDDPRSVRDLYQS